ncbi:LysR substrate-binding domain-containing protein [Devosia nitrariae]|uniref:LysR substrate-binding domain-containing protein n=1 Tax=Devosia nitrariae TaxID=2071872 RepID=UPI0024E18B85|nr:LysR substrate-binding domain-containing protein [Devosia nitrariae]
MRAVEAVGRLGTLAAAAEDLNISASAVSQHLQNAEGRIGMKLFERRPSGLVPTPAGIRLLPRLANGFREIVDGVAGLQASDSKVLTITMGPAFASAWLVSRLGRFSQAYPGIQLRLVATTDLIDLTRSDIDLAIRLGVGPWDGLACHRLIAQSIFPVAVPDLARQLQGPADLAKVPVIREDNSGPGWPEWFAAAGISNMPLVDGPVYSDPQLAFEAALAGQGVMLAWSLIAADALRDQRLVRPFAQALPTELGYWLVSTPDASRKSKVKAFRSWIEAELRLSDAGLQTESPADAPDATASAAGAG